MSKSRLLTLVLLVGASRAQAVPILFNGWGAGQFGLVAVTPTVNLAGNVSTSGGIFDAGIAVATGVNLALSSGTVTGAIDFADPATKSTGGSCASDPGGVCKVDTASTFTGGTVTGVTLQYSAAVTNALNEWNNLIAAGAWGSTTGAMAVNLGSSGSPYVLCAGSGQTGCTSTNNTTTTRVINGQTQTAYVFDISGTTGGTVNQNVTIKGDGSTLVVLIYNSAANALNVAKTFTLSGLTADQVLLNVTSSKGITTASGFNFTGAMAVADTTETLTGSVINGRLFLNGSATATLNGGFTLNATADINSPEPSTEMLIGGALVLLAAAGRKIRFGRWLRRNRY